MYNNKLNNLFNTYSKLLIALCVIIVGIMCTPVISNAASLSLELGSDTTFQIQEYFSSDYREVTVIVYDRETNEPIEQIKVELYYQETNVAYTGSNGQYLTDSNGTIIFQLSSQTVNDTYHIEINAPGYYPYVGEDFILTGNMDIVIYLDPLPEVPEIPEIEDEPEELPPEEPEQPEEPEAEDTEQLPDSEEGQQEIPKTGDDTYVILYTLLALSSALGILIFLLLGRRKDEEDEESNEDV